VDQICDSPSPAPAEAEQVPSACRMDVTSQRDARRRISGAMCAFTVASRNGFLLHVPRPFPIEGEGCSFKNYLPLGRAVVAFAGRGKQG